MAPLPRIHTLGDYRDFIAGAADYAEAGTGSHRATGYLALGIHGELGAVSEQYRKAARNDHGVISPERTAKIKDALSSAFWYITRAITEHGTENACLLWGHSIADIQPVVHVDTPAHAWLSVPRIVAQTDFTELHDVQVLLRTLGVAAARHGWTLQDLAWHTAAKTTRTHQEAAA
jgi:hypothetical protein